VIKRVYHITFPVSDLKKAVPFYENILELKKTGEWSNYATFDVGGVQFGLEPSKRFEIFLLVDDVDETYRDLKTKGVKFTTEPKDQHWGARTATFMDPDGNKFTIETFKKDK
jgi:catechol 2,3-dioxygenase-like lactoylglutathione lyase family enzyme